MHPDWLSNSFVIADREGGTAVFVDSGADVDAARRGGRGAGARRRPRILRTHSHHDHVVHEDELRARYGIDVVAEPGEWEWGGLRVRGVATPGHSDDMVAFLVDDAVFTGDTLFKDAVGGGDLEQVRASVMDVFMALPDETRVLPGHTDETTIGREREPRIRSCASGRGAEPEGTERVDGRRPRRRRSSSGRPTTTARARPGSASTTATTRSSAAPASSAADGSSGHVRCQAP